MPELRKIEGTSKANMSGPVGADTGENLMTLCARCHQEIHCRSEIRHRTCQHYVLMSF